jgi:hypothetical protein
MATEVARPGTFEQHRRVARPDLGPLDAIWDVVRLP